MSKQVKSLGEWLDSLGYSNSVWLGGDWHQPLHLLSKLLANELNERRTIENQDQVSFKIGYDSLTKLAEETFGIPCLVTERDLMVQYPNIFLAQLVYLVSLKHSLDRIDIKTLAATKAPKLVFEARNVNDGQFPKCPSCEEHVFFVERVHIESSVWHRSCFKCVECGEKLKNGGFKKTKAGYECIIHAVRKILDEKEPTKSHRPKVAPPAPPPEKSSMENLQVDVRDSASASLPSPGSTSSAERLSVSARVKPVPPPKPKGLMSPKPPVVDESQSSCDSGFYSAMDALTIKTDNDNYDSIPEPSTEQSGTKVPLAPVAPPRPKRASMLLTSAMTPPLTPQPRLPVASPNNASVPPKPARRLSATAATMSQTIYPDNLCPFDEESEDTQVNFAYDESKNPFADSDDEEETPTPAPRTIFSPCVLGESDRPKVQPPPPPEVPMERALPAAKLLSPVSDLDKLRTLRLSKKKFRAPLPPKMMKQRQIQFTENQIKEDSKLINNKVEDLDDQIAGSERDGKNLEKELLFLITTNPKDWFKMPKTDEYISILTRLLDTFRHQTYLLYSWKEAFLNEIHAETECLLRGLVEKDLQDEYSINREKQLTSLLIFIIDEKAKLTESNIDNEEYGRDSSVTRKENKKKKLRLRLAVLTKKLTHKKDK